MKKKIIYGLLFAVAMVTASSSFVSCKDYEGDNYAEFQEKLASLQDAYDKQVQAMQDYVLTSRYNNETGYSAAELAAKGTIKKRLDDLENDTNSLAQRIHDNNKAIAYATALAKADSARSWDDSIRIDKLENALKGWGDNLTEAVEEAAKVAATVAADSAKWNTASEAVAKDSAKWNTASETVAKDSAIWNKAVEVADSAWNWIKSGKPADSLEYKNLAEMIKDFKDADKALQAQIDSLKQDIANILGTLKKQISGVIIQGTYSPVFGYGSLPLGIQTNILAAYAGKAVITSQFPSDVKTHYASGKAVLSKADFDFANSLNAFTQETITEGDLLMNEEKGNAGKMYLTVNPTNIDFSGTDFKLVNTQGQESRIELSGLNASDEVLTFGWTRGSKIEKESSNGFYEVSATISKDNALKMQPRFDKAGFKKAVQTATDGQKRMAVKEAARALFNSLQPVDRFGVKAEWQDTIGKRSVTSAYDIAAMSIEPLGFGFKLPDGLISLPTIDKKVIAEKLHINMTVDPIVITEKDKATGKYVIKVEVDAKELDLSLIDDDNYYVKYYTYEKKDDPSSMIEVSLVDVKKLLKDPNFQKDTKIVAVIDVTPQFEEMFGQFNASFANFNGAAADINKEIDNVASTVNSYIDRANGWINRINNLFNNLGTLVQPVLLWSDGENAGELGGLVSANYAVGTAVKAGSDLALIPTSYSLELFAPAYKKSLLVTNAFKGGNSAQDGDATLKAAAQALSDQLKDYTVFKGNSIKNPIKVNVGNNAGVTFEIAYTAVDYEGKVAGRKFYFTVVE